MGGSTIEYIQSLKATTITLLVDISFYVLDISFAFFTKLRKIMQKGPKNTNPMINSFSKKN